MNIGLELFSPSKDSKHERRPTLRREEVSLGALLGEGGFGKVYRGRCRSFEVAVKVPLQVLEGEVLENFRHEISLLSTLNHPRLALFLGAYVGPDGVMICMELLDGDVDSLMRRDEKACKISLFQRIRWAQQAAEGMAWLHGAGVVHRDIKPSNLLYSRRTNSIKVSDFGLSEVLGKGGKLADGRLVGNPRFWAPEVLLREPWAQPVDVYAFGVSLYTFITRKEAFIEWWHGGGMDPNFVDAVVDQNVRPWLPDDPLLCPTSLRRLTESCWQPDPSSRPTFEDIIRVMETEVLLECAVLDSKGRELWLNHVNTNDTPGLLRETNWRTFEAAFLKIYGVPADQGHHMIYVYKLFCSGFNALGREVITLEHFGRMLGFFPDMSDISSLCSQHWFWGDSSKHETCAFLRIAPIGTFIVRCANAATFRIEVKHKDEHVGHYLINHIYQERQFSSPEIPDQIFSSIEDLIKGLSKTLDIELVPPERSPMTVLV